MIFRAEFRKQSFTWAELLLQLDQDLLRVPQTQHNPRESRSSLGSPDRVESYASTMLRR